MPTAEMLRFHSILFLLSNLSLLFSGREMTRHHLFNSETLEVFPIGIGEYTIGRSSHGSIVVKDPKASVHHAAISGDSAGQFVIRDLGSTNGTLVNGVKVTESLLAAGDSIRIGSVTLSFVGDPENFMEWMRQLWNEFVAGVRNGMREAENPPPSPLPTDGCAETVASMDPLRVKAEPQLVEELIGWSSLIDRYSILLAIVPWFFSPALGAAGLNAAYFRIRAKETGQPIPAWPLLILAVLGLVWLVLSGWGSWLAKGTLLVGLSFVALKFYRDNAEIWKNIDWEVLRKAIRRTASFSVLIMIFLLPGIAVGCAAHELLRSGFAMVAEIPRAELTKYFDDAWPAAAPPAPSPSMWLDPKGYLAYKLDPWRLLVGKVEVARTVSRDTLRKSKIDTAPAQISNAAIGAYRFLHFIWWLFIAHASYVAIRLYLYVFSRVFVGRGGRAVLQLDCSS